MASQSGAAGTINFRNGIDRLAKKEIGRAKTETDKIERCTFPQWDGGGGTVSIAFPTDDEYHFTVMKPIPDPTMGPFLPHLIFKRAPVP